MKIKLLTIFSLSLILITSCHSQVNMAESEKKPLETKNQNPEIQKFILDNPDDGEPSVSKGVVSNGTLLNGKLLPYSGSNFQYFADVSFLKGRAFVHSSVKKIVVDSYKILETKYQTNNDKTIIGQSLGGLFATEVLLKKPTLFNKYIIISPSLWWDNGSLLNQSSNLLTENYNQQTDIYIGVGKEGLTPTEIPRVMEVDANLLTEKIKGSKSKKVKVFFDYLPQENHATIMHQAVSNSFRLLYPITTKE